MKDKLCDVSYIIDTKWKVLSEAKSNYGISQADMYQMYAYQKKYNAKNVSLIYPCVEKISSDKVIEYQSKDGVIVKVKFVDLFDVKNSLSKIVDDFRDQLTHVEDKEDCLKILKVIE